ncbi:MAG: hypothetical protein ACI3X1_06245 [Eubacteriales bacterium]
MKILKIFKKPVFLITLVLLAAVLSISVVAAETGECGKVTSYEVGMQGSVYLKLNVSTGDMAVDDYFEVVVEGKEAEQYPVGQITDNKILVKLAPTEMNKTVTVTPVMGGTSGTAQTFSVKKYADAVLALTTSPYTDSHDAMRTLLNWGAKSEAFFGEGTSSIDIGEIFTKNTDPSTVVTAANITKPDKADLSSSGVFVDGTHMLNLILSEGNISLRFDFAASSKLETAKVTITRGETVIAQDQPVSYSGGNYTVKINGITTSLFDDVYTVTVSDGGENSITAQASVLEYLKAIVGGEANVEDKDAERIATAQALFQFYQATTNTFSSATCTHTYENFFWIHTGDASYSKCSACFGDLNIKVPDSINYYADLGTITGEVGHNGLVVNKYQYDDTNDVWYHNLTVTGNTSFLYISRNFTNADADLTSARYMIVKYRMPDNSNINFYSVKTSVDGETDVKTYDLAEIYSTSNAWRVVVLDLGDKIKSADTKISITATVTNYADIAYVALTDNLSEAKELITDQQVMVRKFVEGQAGFLYVATVDKTELDCSSGHAFTAAQENVDDGTKYSYSCSRAWCDYKYETIVPSNVNYFADLQTMTELAGNNNSVFSKYMYDEDNDVLFNRITIPDENSNYLYVTGQEFKSADLSNARYLIIKHRMASGWMQFDPIQTQNSADSTKSGQFKTANIYPTPYNDWLVTILDLHDIIKSETNDQILISLLVNQGVDIAYIAVTDSVEEAKGLITDELVYLRDRDASSGALTYKTQGTIDQVIQYVNTPVTEN